MGNVTNKIAGLDLAKIIDDAWVSAGGTSDLGGQPNATLLSVTPGSGTDADPNELTPTGTSHTARGFIDDYDDNKIDGTIIRKADRMVFLFGASITPSVAPKTNDRITIEGDTYSVERVARDPAGASYVLQVR